MTTPGVDPAELATQARICVEHPEFDAAMRAFCRDVSRFHSIGFSRQKGVVDTITWATAMVLLYLDAFAPGAGQCESARRDLRRRRAERRDRRA